MNCEFYACTDIGRVRANNEDAVFVDAARGLALLAARIEATAQLARAEPELAGHAGALATALARLQTATQAAWAGGLPGEILANAVPYMQAFGHVVVAWIWLELSIAARASADATRRAGVDGARTYFFHYELPRIEPWLRVVETRDTTCVRLPEEAF